MTSHLKKTIEVSKENECDSKVVTVALCFALHLIQKNIGPSCNFCSNFNGFWLNYCKFLFVCPIFQVNNFLYEDIRFSAKEI